MSDRPVVTEQGKIIRIGGASAFFGDSLIALPQLLRLNTLDYVMADFLAEITLSSLSAERRRSSDLGYSRHFTEWMWRENLPALLRRSTRLITNAGGLNPRACRARMLDIAADQGLHPRIAIVEGDDLLSSDVAPACLQEQPNDGLQSANAYLGAFGIAQALAAGADVVITGRVVDSALALGPLIHEFGWQPSDLDQLAAGTLAGHLLECGAQATGATFTDWEAVPDWANIGYPIAEVDCSGRMILTKPPGTGGLCTVATVAEQMLYEVGDPAAYLVPDVSCDFTAVTLRSVGPDRVSIEGARGRSPPETCKVVGTIQDGFRTTVQLPIIGMDAAAKAERTGAALIGRATRLLAERRFSPLRRSHLEIIGAEASYGVRARCAVPREVMLKLAVEHEERAALDLLQREWMSATTSMAVGTTSWYGNRPTLDRIVRILTWSVPREAVCARVDFDGQGWSVPFVAPEDENARPADPLSVDEAIADADNLVPVPLVRLAWARSGDKGNTFNIGVIARDRAVLPYIRAALTHEAVCQWFADTFPTDASPWVERFELPGIAAMNFLFHDALDGGGAATPAVDMLAKCKAQILLEMPVPVPSGLARNLKAVRS